MASNECRRFEDAVASDAQVDDALSRHAMGCTRCRALAEIVALRIALVPPDSEDPVVRSIRAAIAGAAAHNAKRWERQRQIIPLAIGIAGYVIAASAALVACLRGLVSLAVPQLSLNAMQAGLPAPSVRQIAAAFAASAVWTAAIALLTRNRQQATRAPAGNG
jgi:hypothetical protein